MRAARGTEYVLVKHADFAAGLLNLQQHHAAAHQRNARIPRRILRIINHIS